jgi:hypothetical protein
VKSDKVLSRHNVEAILREYNSAQMVFAPSPKGDHNVRFSEEMCTEAQFTFLTFLSFVF